MFDFLFQHTSVASYFDIMMVIALGLILFVMTYYCVSSYIWLNKRGFRNCLFIDNYIYDTTYRELVLFITLPFYYIGYKIAIREYKPVFKTIGIILSIAFIPISIGTFTVTFLFELAIKLISDFKNK